MAHLKHLLCRNGWYYFRARVPKDLVSVFGRKEICFSLKTKCARSAQLLHKTKTTEINKIFTLSRSQMLSQEQLHALLRESSLESLSFTEGERYKGNMHFASNSLNEVVGFNLEMIEHALSSMNYILYEPHVKGIISENNLDIDHDSDEYRMFCREALKYLYDVMKVEQERCKGNYSNDFDHNARPALIQTVDISAQANQQHLSMPAKKEKTLSKVIDLYMETKKEKAPSTLENYRGMNKLILKVLEDNLIGDYEYEDFLEAKKMLEKIPKNATSTEGWEEMSLDEIINLKNSMGPISSTTVDKYLTHINTLFKFAAKRDWINKSPCPTWERSKKDKRQKKKIPYSNQDLESLLKSPHYSIVTRRYKDPQNFWAALLGKLNGLRVDEACQLYKTDIQQIDGIWCMSINDEEDKKVKSEAAIRIIPIHPILLELGFLDYIAAIDHTRLFPGLKNNPKKGQGYSHDFDKNINKYLRRHVTKDKRKTFHSTRHSFASNLKEHGIHNDLIGALLGHEAPNEVTEGYSGKYTLSTMLDAMKKLDYGIDVKDLVGRWDPEKCGGKVARKEPRRQTRNKAKDNILFF